MQYLRILLFNHLFSWINKIFDHVSVLVLKNVLLLDKNFKKYDNY